MNYVLEKIIKLERANKSLLVNREHLGDDGIALVRAIAIQILELKKKFLSQTVDMCEKDLSQAQEILSSKTNPQHTSA